MKKLLQIIVLSVFMLSVSSAQLTAGGPANKATGDVILENDVGEQVVLVFNAHEAKDHRPAKGMAIAEITTETYWEVEVSCVTVVSETEAYFGGQVLDAQNAAVSVGDYIMLRVIDNGEPGIYVDEVYYGWTDVEGVGEFEEFCAEPVSEYTPEGWGEVIEGNVQVHYYAAPGPPGNLPNNEYSSLGNCISTRKSENCEGLRGRERAACVQGVKEYCQELFGIPSNSD